MNRFYEAGENLANEHIAYAELNGQLMPPLKKNSDLKAFTVRVPDSLAGAMDLVATSLNTSRSILVQDILIECVADAFIEYHRGYYSMFSLDYSFEKFICEKLNELKDKEGVTDGFVTLTHLVIHRLAGFSMDLDTYEVWLNNEDVREKALDAERSLADALRVKRGNE